LGFPTGWWFTPSHTTTAVTPKEFLLICWWDGDLVLSSLAMQ
jgi:hypothetical protein